ncbi:MAG TPA: BtrH N-terminal domain-containing protein [Actinoplanes sp.]|nr:BtrH N-terminal domain-containing protein [Actinoplanes sp.]
MTAQKHLKARIRARMAKTGERYAAARRHVAGDTRPVTDHGWTLRGGQHPDTAVISHLLADRGVPLSEAMVLGIGGGLGAGYILWEFAQHDHPDLTLGFRHRWNYLDATDRTLDRLGVRYTVHTTAGAKAAARQLSAALAEGRRAIIVPDWYRIGYWQLPPNRDGHGGHPVVAYAETAGGVRIDDRNTGPLTVDRAAVDAARARVSSYRNRLVLIDQVATPDDLAGAVRAGVRDCVQHLGGTSASFALPAWRKWAKMCTDRRHAKGWPTVFAGGRGLAGALLTAWEEIEPVGMSGGNLRGLYADFLDEAAPLLGPAASGAAAEFRAAAGEWHAFAEAALPPDVPEYARLRELTAAVAEGVALGAPAADAGAELWDLRRELDEKPPVAPDFGMLAERMTAVHAAEESAVAALRGVEHGD